MELPGRGGGSWHGTLVRTFCTEFPASQAPAGPGLVFKGRLIGSPWILMLSPGASLRLLVQTSPTRACTRAPQIGAHLCWTVLIRASPVRQVIFLRLPKQSGLTVPTPRCGHMLLYAHDLPPIYTHHPQSERIPPNRTCCSSCSSDDKLWQAWRGRSRASRTADPGIINQRHGDGDETPQKCAI